MPEPKKKKDVDPERAELARLHGRHGAIKRWGEGHGKTVTVRMFQDVADLLRHEIPEKDRAKFVTDAVFAKLDEKLGGGAELVLGAFRL